MAPALLRVWYLATSRRRYPIVVRKFDRPASLRGSKLILAVVLAASTGVGCNGSNGPDPVPAGAYAYSGFDSAGRLVVTGSLTLDVQDPAHVAGTWSLQSSGSVQALGPQIGDGQLQGAMNGSNLTVNLNPQQNDNNVFLSGTLDGHTYRGQWTYSGFAGVLNQGSFEAIQR
jgi:hypothetical protein